MEILAERTKKGEFYEEEEIPKKELGINQLTIEQLAKKVIKGEYENGI